MNEISKPHDSWFKKYLADLAAAKDFLLIHLPTEIQEKMDFSSLSLAPGSYVDKHLKQFCSDILYSVKNIQEENCYIYCLIEHQSTPDPLMAFRLIRYSLAVMQQHLDQKGEELPIVIPLLFYQGKQTPYPHSMRFVDCFADVELATAIYQRPFPLIDVTVIPDTDILTHRRAALLELIQKHIWARDMLGIGSLIAKLLNNFPLSHEQCRSMLCYISERGEVSDERQFFDAIIEGAPNYREDVMTIAQRLEQRGAQQGRQEEKLEMVIRMLQANLPTDSISQISGLSEAEITKLRKDLAN